MLPVDQTETELGRGNCLAACVASILDLDISEVPNFRLSPDAWESMQEWLSLRGLCAVRVSLGSIVRAKPGLSCIVTGNSPRNPVLHAVVGRWDGESAVIIHDPHPEKTGLIGDALFLTFFCKMT